MATPSQGQRFEALDKEFNVAMTSISKSDPKDILNTGFNSLAQIIQALKGLLDQIKGKLDVKKAITGSAQGKAAIAAAGNLGKIAQSFGDAPEQLEKIMKSLRQIKGSSRSTFDPAKLSSTNFDRYVEQVFAGDPTSQNLFKDINGPDRNKALSNVTTGTPFKPTVAIPDPGGLLPPEFYVGDTNSDYYQVATLLDSSTGNNYPQYILDNNANLRRAVIVGNLAYDANLPNVLQAISSIPGMRPDVLARATAIILEEQASKGNVAALLDIAQHISQDNFPMQQAPSVVKDLVTTFRPTPSTKEEQLPDLAVSFFTSLTALDPKWNVSLTDGIPSIRSIPQVSPKLAVALRSKVMNNIFHPTTGISAIFNTADDVISAAALAASPMQEIQIDLLSADVSCVPYQCDC